MSLLRAAARTMLASFFIVNGYKAFRHPEPLVPAAQPLADALLPLAERTLPPMAAAYLPEDTRGLVRCTGIAQLVGGVSLATGIGRRLGAGLLAATMVPHVLASNPFGAHGKDREVAQALLVRNVALTGGVLLASVDTEGQPNLAWRARAQRDAMEKGAERLRLQAARDAQKAQKAARSLARKASSRLESALS